MNKMILFILFIFYISFSQAPQSIKGWMLADSTIDTSKVNDEFKSLMFGGINALYYGFDPDNSADDNFTLNLIVSTGSCLNFTLTELLRHCFSPVLASFLP